MSENTKRHKALIEFLQQFDLYKNSRIIETERNTTDLVKIDIDDILKSANDIMKIFLRLSACNFDVFNRNFVK